MERDKEHPYITSQKNL